MIKLFKGVVEYEDKCRNLTSLLDKKYDNKYE